jgi:DtxR family Mn-dependent transcriptional regulator
MPTSTLQEYLETIYKLSSEGVVRPTQIAEALGVSGATVTATLKRLQSRGLVEREGTKVVLTEEGVVESLEVVRRHRIAERFLVDLLGLDWEAAHEEACVLEHALSPRVLEALERYLGDPTECPHGHPIPSSAGVVAPSDGRRLGLLNVGESSRVVRVAEDEALGYLGELGLVPGALVTVLEVGPFGGPLTIEVEGQRRAISRDLADIVTVVEP